MRVLYHSLLLLFTFSATLQGQATSYVRPQSPTARLSPPTARVKTTSRTNVAHSSHVDSESSYSLSARVNVNTSQVDDRPEVRITCNEGTSYPLDFPSDCAPIISGLRPDGLGPNLWPTWHRITSRSYNKAHKVPQRYSRGSCKLDVSFIPRFTPLAVGPTIALAKSWLYSIHGLCPSGQGGLVEYGRLRFLLGYSQIDGAVSNNSTSDSAPHLPTTQVNTSLADTIPVHSQKFTCLDASHVRVNFAQDCVRAISDLYDDGLPIDARTPWGTLPPIPESHRVPQKYLQGTCKVSVTLEPPTINRQHEGPSVALAKAAMRHIGKECELSGAGGYWQFGNLYFWVGYYGHPTQLLASDSNNTQGIPTISGQDTQNSVAAQSPLSHQSHCFIERTSPSLGFRPYCEILINSLVNGRLTVNDRADWAKSPTISSLYKIPQVHTYRTCRLDIGLRPFWHKVQRGGPSRAMLKTWLFELERCHDKGGIVTFGRLSFGLGYNPESASALGQGVSLNSTTATTADE